MNHSNPKPIAALPIPFLNDKERLVGKVMPIFVGIGPSIPILFGMLLYAVLFRREIVAFMFPMGLSTFFGAFGVLVQVIGVALPVSYLVGIIPAIIAGRMFERWFERAYKQEQAIPKTNGFLQGCVAGIKTVLWIAIVPLMCLIMSLKIDISVLFQENIVFIGRSGQAAFISIRQDAIAEFMSWMALSLSALCMHFLWACSIAGGVCGVLAMRSIRKQALATG